ncbi:MAG: TonB-dependent receptor [Gammaproteobacteria bacterium]|nr:TonB-dependent receptor [Gammaproteobacteria bacterium]
MLAYGRAAILLPDDTILRLDQNTTVTFTEPQDETRSWLELLKGAIHIISRDPQALKVITPFAGAGLEGTEFLIVVTEDETIVTVYEGEVSVSTDFGDVNVTPGQRVTARTGQQPIAQVAVRPRDAVQWTLYYAPIFDDEIPAADEEAQADQADNPLFYTGRASKRLAVGRVDEARTDIAQALNIDPTNVDALALQSIIAVAQNDLDSAFALANRALAQDSDSGAAMIALSYAQQAILDISGALITMQSAVERHPSNGLGWARLSELWLAVGDLNQSLIAAQTAVDLNSNVARAQTVLGFAYLAQIEIPQAIDAFNKAIILDQAAPLPRLGLGLAMIRAGDLAAGRAEIEIAVILDPGNALIRSYLGKAYYEEKRDDLAESQFDISKKLDPLDPTPWFYDAIRKQTENQPIEALADLEASIERNDNRAVYRSRPNLDRDRAVRGTSQARIYDDLGFEQLGVVEGTKSLSIDPANHSAHRFLSDSYATRPRHEIARASELLQSQLLQPINMNPVQPQLPEIDLSIVTGAGPAEAAFNEFTPLFERNGHQFVVSGLSGSNDTWADEVVLSGIKDRVSYSIGQFHHESDGFRTNNDVEHDIYNLFAQAALSEQIDIQFEFRKRETEQGDLRLNFDPDDFSVSERRIIEQDVGRLSLHLAPSPRSDFVVSLIQTDREEALNQMDPMTPTLDVDLETGGDDIQGQYLFRGNRFNVTAGLGASDIDVDRRQVIDLSPTFPGGICPPFPPFFGVCTITTIADTENEQRNAYVYVNVIGPTDVTWTVGASHDSVEEGFLDVDESNPKVGLRWDVTDKVRLRAAYLETVKRTLVAEQTLEPTQVAGFAQFFDDFNGTKAELYGVGLDVTLRQPERRNSLSSGLYAGFELSHRDLEIPRIQGTTGMITPEDQREDLDRVYLYWTPHPEWAVRVEIQRERFKRTDTLGLSLPTEVETTSLPFVVRYFRAAGLFAQVGTTFVQQDVDLAPTSTFGEDSEDFVVVDAAIGYRLPRRRGILSLEVRNLFDEDFLFQDANIQRSEPSNPRFIPDRTVMGRVTLSF